MPWDVLALTRWVWRRWVRCQVREFAEEEGPKSPFAYLNDDITRVLTTVLVLTTVSQVVSTVLFTTVMSRTGVSFTKATTFLTFFTLFFGELLPKALGVSNAEMVARATVPVISVLAVFFSPFALMCKVHPPSPLPLRKSTPFNSGTA
jgi:putative hemolysin